MVTTTHKLFNLPELKQWNWNRRPHVFRKLMWGFENSRNRCRYLGKIEWIEGLDLKFSTYLIPRGSTHVQLPFRTRCSSWRRGAVDDDPRAEQRENATTPQSGTSRGSWWGCCGVGPRAERRAGEVYDECTDSAERIGAKVERTRRRRCGVGLSRVVPGCRRRDVRWWTRDD